MGQWAKLGLFLTVALTLLGTLIIGSQPMLPQDIRFNQTHAALHGEIDAGIDTLKESVSEDTLLSRRDSFGFIMESNKHWLMRKQIHREQIKREARHLHECSSWTREWFQCHYEPSFHCMFQERIGRMGDGGKWICDPVRIRKRVKSGQERCLVYSVGSNGDFSFEESVLSDVSKGCEIHTFDPANASKWKLPSHVQYHSVALGMTPPAKPLREIVKGLGHSGLKIDLFKIDCEGCEWETYKSWFDGGVDIRQILVELHGRQDSEKGGILNTAEIHDFFWFLFERGYVIFNKEANTVGDANCFEYSFLKLSQSFSPKIIRNAR